MEFDFVNTNVAKKQGNVGVGKAIYEYTKRGYTVLIPFTDSDLYDIVICMNGIFYKVQVKTSRSLNKLKKYQISLSTKGGNTTKNITRVRREQDYDLLFVLLETGDCWSIPNNSLGNAKHCIVLPCDKYEQYRLI